jgi:predicted O-methyltransferase YrrM
MLNITKDFMMITRFALVLSLTLVFFAATDAGASLESDNSRYLENWLNRSDKRYGSFMAVMDLLVERQAKLLVETGTSRGGASNFVGDGGSTIIFADWASQHGAYLFTIDIDPGAIANARNASQDYSDNVEYVCSDSIKYLTEFGQQIDFLYLDSYDFNASNPAPSQNHHLYEIQAAYDKLHDNSIVMIDDCDLPHGGKGKLIIEYLLEKGWKIVYSGYQVILVQN